MSGFVILSAKLVTVGFALLMPLKDWLKDWRRHERRSKKRSGTQTPHHPIRSLYHSDRAQGSIPVQNYMSAKRKIPSPATFPLD